MRIVDSAWQLHLLDVRSNRSITKITKLSINLAIATSFIALVSTTASADLLSIDLIAGDPASLEGALPLGATHDVAVTQGAEGWYYANLSATQDVTLTYEFLGFEAGWTNTLLVDGSQVFWNRVFDGNAASSAGDTATSAAGAGELLNFGFDILVGLNAGLGVTNGFNNYPINTFSGINNQGAPNFFLGYVEGSGGNSVYITLDDGGGGPWQNNSIDDDNHDDMVIKVTAVAVPEPGTIGLLGIGLFGMGLFGWRRNI